jgi:hypothetical protein
MTQAEPFKAKLLSEIEETSFLFGGVSDGSVAVGDWDFLVSRGDVKVESPCDAAGFP